MTYLAVYHLPFWLGNMVRDDQILDTSRNLLLTKHQQELSDFQACLVAISAFRLRNWHCTLTIDHFTALKQRTDW